MGKFSIFDSRFSFVCPVFNAKTEMRACAKLREMVWMGKRPDVRRGCQACMRASKCPAATIIKRVSFEKGYDASEYVSGEPIDGRLSASVLELISAPIVSDHTMNECLVGSAERSLILSANDRIRTQLATAPRSDRKKAQVMGSGKTRRGSDSQVKMADVSEAPKKSKLNSDAATGNLSAAVNAGDIH